MKWVFRIVGGLVGLGVVLIATLAISLFASALRPSRPVGFQQIMVADPGRAPIPVSVWYPTDAKPGFVLLGSVGQRVASDGPVTGDRLPLVVISHGTGGSGSAGGAGSGGDGLKYPTGASVPLMLWHSLRGPGQSSGWQPQQFAAVASCAVLIIMPASWSGCHCTGRR